MTNNKEESPSNEKSKEDLGKFLKKIEKQQDLGPFNIRDSGIIEELHKKLEENAVNYDDEPVCACPHCSSLYLKEIEGHLECFNCGNPVEEKHVDVYSSIIMYLNRNEGS